MEEKEKRELSAEELQVKEDFQQKTKEMSDEEKKAWISLLLERRNNLIRTVASKRVRSINRAVKRDRITPQGFLGPKHPFNNRPNRSTRKGVHSRVSNEFKKKLYEQFKKIAAKQSV